MLKNEFGKKYTKEQVEEYKTELKEVQNFDSLNSLSVSEYMLSTDMFKSKAFKSSDIILAGEGLYASDMFKKGVIYGSECVKTVIAPSDISAISDLQTIKAEPISTVFNVKDLARTGETIYGIVPPTTIDYTGYKVGQIDTENLTAKKSSEILKKTEKK